ncbi:hypothetical protein GLA29479_4280 [Lysobacter antibioticus]|uniref:Uncharacterized protein n=1 Tax=Lysobacter antibioticus TaxID=84531 RepID=A0A0S2E2U7_LYSAN|nr:hypothetical protein GLA29479_4280 [Lysobacter antibioticus]ALN79314.1 hypothetical protein LA76x_1155 [Lysobacter antibioticus]
MSAHASTPRVNRVAGHGWPARCIAERCSGALSGHAPDKASECRTGCPIIRKGMPIPS